MELEKVLNNLVKVAENTPVVKRMWVFGSRLKNTHRPDSDLDIAVEVEWEPRQMLGVCEDSFSLWYAASSIFKHQMADLCPCALDLQCYAGEEKTPNVHQYLKSASRIIYEKPPELNQYVQC